MFVKIIKLDGTTETKEVTADNYNHAPGVAFQADDLKLVFTEMTKKDRDMCYVYQEIL